MPYELMKQPWNDRFSAPRIVAKAKRQVAPTGEVCVAITRECGSKIGPPVPYLR
jgi:hypothetical protein